MIVTEREDGKLAVLLPCFCRRVLSVEQAETLATDQAAATAWLADHQRFCTPANRRKAS